MTNNIDAFTSSVVLGAVARELKFDLGDLDVTSAGSSDVVQDPCDHYVVKSRSTSFCVTVHRDKASAETLCRALVEKWLVKGSFFDEMLPSRELLDAVVESCDLDGLRSWLAASAREGWVFEGQAIHSSEFSDSKTPRTIEDIKKCRAKLLEEYLRDPLNAVLRLHRGDLAETIGVLLEQCPYEPFVMIGAVVRSQGGWEGFSYGMVATTSEGFLVEAENEYTVEYMVRLYDSQDVSGRGSSGQGSSRK